MNYILLTSCYIRLGWDDLLVFLRYGPDFQKQRRFFQQTLTRQECLMYRSIQLEQAHTLLKNLLRSPDDFYAHIRRYLLMNPLSLAYFTLKYPFLGSLLRLL